MTGINAPGRKSAILSIVGEGPRPVRQTTGETSADAPRNAPFIYPLWERRGGTEVVMKTLPDLWTRDLMTDPFRAFERELFGRDLPKMFDMPKAMNLAPVMAPMPAMNIAETDKTIEATLEIPGVEEQDIKVRVEGDRLIVSGEKNWESRKDEKDWHVVERRFGAFHRSVILPFEPAADAIAAHYDKGVLHLTVQKPATEETTAKTIPVTKGAPKANEPPTPH
jgi:HSP20 family protein